MSLKQPVQYPVKHYSHLDAGAPQLANADGIIKTILKSCLLTGYGDKEGAGWTSLFEDDYRIVLRRPLRTGNPPDIKIENGVFNGAVRHRIVIQDNPTGLDDGTELESGNLLARDANHGVEWYLIVSDFGFIFCYALAEDQWSDGSRKPLCILYIGSLIGATLEVPSMYVSYQDTVLSNGKADPWMHGFLDGSVLMKSADRVLGRKLILDFSSPPADAMQRIFFDGGESLPFYTSLKDLGKTKNVVQTLDGRPFLTVCNINYQEYNRRTFYIPLDYWEL